jgi:hypothetical protein
VVTGGQDSVGLRCPAHPLALEVLRAFGGGLAAPSANRFGHISPTSAAHVAREFGAAVPVVLDGGDCEIGIESTIVDLVSEQPRILRPGRITREQLVAVIGHVEGCARRRQPARLRHARGALRAAHADADARARGDGTRGPRSKPRSARTSPCSRSAPLPPGFAGEVLPEEPRGYAHGLYAAPARARCRRRAPAAGAASTAGRRLARGQRPPAPRRRRSRAGVRLAVNELGERADASSQFGRALAALPDALTAGAYAWAWLQPLRFGEGVVKTLMLVMLMEFLVVHSGGFLGVTVLSDGFTRVQKSLAILGFGCFYLLFARPSAWPSMPGGRCAPSCGCWARASRWCGCRRCRARTRSAGRCRCGRVGGGLPGRRVPRRAAAACPELGITAQVHASLSLEGAACGSKSRRP